LQPSHTELACVLGVVWPQYHAPSDGVFGCFDLAALSRLPHLKLFLLLLVNVPYRVPCNTRPIDADS
jgi:hypothetical protein